MKIDIKDYKSIVDIKTGKEEGCYTLSFVFDNNHVVVYGFPTLREFVICYTKFMNDYRR